MTVTLPLIGQFTRTWHSITRIPEGKMRNIYLKPIQTRQLKYFYMPQETDATLSLNTLNTISWDCYLWKHSQIPSSTGIYLRLLNHTIFKLSKVKIHHTSTIRSVVYTNHFWSSKKAFPYCCSQFQQWSLERYEIRYNHFLSFSILMLKLIYSL